jgi:stage V sporulation protein SpoVS
MTGSFKMTTPPALLVSIGSEVASCIEASTLRRKDSAKAESVSRMAGNGKIRLLTLARSFLADAQQDG